MIKLTSASTILIQSPLRLRSDMECDGLKQSLLVDKDGSFLGKPGAILPEAEFEWDGDKRRGLGDYR